MTPSAKGLEEPFPALLANVNGGQKIAVSWKRIRALAIRRAARGQRFVQPVETSKGVASSSAASSSGVEAGKGVRSRFVIRKTSVPPHFRGKDFRPGKIYQQETQNPAEQHKRHRGAESALSSGQPKPATTTGTYRTSATFSESKSKVNSLVSPAPREIFSSRVMVLPSFSISTLMV